MSSPTQIIDFSRYLPPGIYTNPIAGPQLGINTALPTAIGIFGTTIGFRQFIESLLINPDTNDTTPAINQTLAQMGINTSTIVVTNPNSGQIYVLNTDYTVVNVGGLNGSQDATYAISRVISGHILPGATIQVHYQYTNAAFFAPYTFYDYADVVTAYGPPFNTTTGAIQSELTLAAKFAFLNGAYQIVCVAVNPANPAAPTVGDYYNALNLFYDQSLIAIIVCANGSMQPLQQLIQEHVDQQSANRFERVAILGMDGTTSNGPVPSSQRILNAEELYDERMVLVSPSTFTYYSTELNNSIVLGGQFMAATLAGMAMNMSWSQPLTRKIITGWTNVAEVMLDGLKSFESSNGLMVVEMAPPHGQRIWVRHGVTTDNGDLIHREWSIIRQQDAMVYTLRAYLNDANLIGQPIFDYTLINVKASVEAGLQSLIVNSLIVDYTGLTVRQLLTNPDVLEVRFSWLPAFPLNYIVLTFGISLTTGSVATVGANPLSSNFTSSGSSLAGVSITAPSPSSIGDFGGASNTLQSD